MKKIIALFFCFILAACAKGPAQHSPDQDDKPWAEMIRMSQQEQGPYRLNLSMRFGEEGNTRRVTALLWGNDQSTLRLDVMVGVGATIAKIADSSKDFVAYLPRENRAYAHTGSNKPLLKVGVPVPFGLSQLSALLTGKFAEVFGSRPDAIIGSEKDGTNYEIAGPLAGRLTIDDIGQPLLWQQAKGGWKLELNYDEETPHLPDSLKLTNLNGKRAIILVKERERPQKPFVEAQLALEIPAGTEVLPLSQFKTAR